MCVRYYCFDNFFSVHCWMCTTRACRYPRRARFVGSGISIAHVSSATVRRRRCRLMFIQKTCVMRTHTSYFNLLLSSGFFGDFFGPPRCLRVVFLFRETRGTDKAAVRKLRDQTNRRATGEKSKFCNGGKELIRCHRLCSKVDSKRIGNKKKKKSKTLSEIKLHCAR